MNMHDDRYLFDREGIYVDYCQTVEKLMKNLLKVSYCLERAILH